jgi:hypothetical protein
MLTALLALAIALAASPAAAQISCKVTARIGCYTDYIQARRCYPAGPFNVESQVNMTPSLSPQ